MTQVDPKLYPLAAMCQASQIALQLATLGNCDEPAFHALIDSLFIFDPADTQAVYGNARRLDLGLLYFGILSQRPFQISQKLALKLILSFVRLAKKILASPPLQEKLKVQLIRIHEQVEYFGSWQHPRVLHNLGDLYIDLATNSSFRLKMSGQKKFLQDVEVINKIRAALFAGVRAAVLWYQLKGNMLWLLWNRKELLHEAKLVLAEKKE
jgi:high frequency lysogenization protein